MKINISEEFFCSICKKNFRNGGSKYCVECQCDLTYKHSREYRYKWNQRFNKWKIIRKKVLERDKYICQLCKRKKDEDVLIIHHKDESGLYSFSNSKTEVNNKMNNLITFCNVCHSAFHTKLNRKRRKEETLFSTL